MKHINESSISAPKPITVEVVGGVGNQLFGYAAGLYCALKCQTNLNVADQDVHRGFTNHGSTIRELDLTCTYETPRRHRTFSLALVSRLQSLIGHRYRTLARLTSRVLKVFVADDVGFVGSLNICRPGYYLRGYFQTHKYFEACRILGVELSPKLLSPSEAYLAQVSRIEEIAPIVVHVRRGDYRKLSETFGLLSTKYYEDAIKLLRKREVLESKPIWVFSDEPEEVRREFQATDFFESLHFPDVSLCSAVEVMLLMSKGSASVISNSTFGWWGAILRPKVQPLLHPSGFVTSRNLWTSFTRPGCDLQVFGETQIKLSIQSFGCDLAIKPSSTPTLLQKFLSDKELVPIGDPSADFYIALEHDSKALRSVKKAVAKSRRFLVIFEPRAVNPSQFKRLVQRNYAKVLVPSCMQATMPNNVTYDAGGLPTQAVVEQDINKNATYGLRGVGVSLIQQNKFSLVKRSGYAKRVDLINELDREGFEFHLAGKDWDRPIVWWLLHQGSALIRCLLSGSAPDLTLFRPPIPLKNVLYHRRVEDSVEFQRRSRFSIVVENDENYVSEKIFNALRAGSIPIYMGADLEKIGIPSSICIEIKDKSPKTVTKILREIDSETAKAILYAGELWLQRHDVQDRWGIEKGHQRIVAIIESEMASLGSTT